jgi:hypothetical protein
MPIKPLHGDSMAISNSTFPFSLWKPTSETSVLLVVIAITTNPNKQEGSITMKNIVKWLYFLGLLVAAVFGLLGFSAS